MVEPNGSALHSLPLTMTIEALPHDSPSLVVVEQVNIWKSQHWRNQPSHEADGWCWFPTQVDVPTTVADSVDVVHVNLTDGGRGRLVTESNRTVPADGWDDDPAEEDDRMSEADVGVRKSPRKMMFHSVFQEWPV